MLIKLQIYDYDFFFYSDIPMRNRARMDRQGDDYPSRNYSAMRNSVLGHEVTNESY